jgi:septum formation protein
LIEAVAPLVLASASPRRRDLLKAAGAWFEVEPSAYDENTVRRLPPRQQALQAARGKAFEVHARRPQDWVVGCDTVVVIDGESLGKPGSARDAGRMLERLSGRDHCVITAVCVVSPEGRRRSGVASSQVRVKPLSPARLEAYVATGEPFDKAGAYAIQGEAGEFTHVVSGRIDTVVGLPVSLLGRLLGQLGHPGAASLLTSTPRENERPQPPAHPRPPILR